MKCSSSTEDPRFRFYSRPRGSTAGVNRGNGIVRSQSGTIWITQDDGSLRILTISDDDITEVQYTPTPFTARTIECRSLPALYEVDGSTRYGVYSVIDKPLNANERIVSRVFALSPKGRKLWEAIVPGIVEGTPQIAVDGRSIYVTHNDLENVGDDYPVGKLSVIHNDRYGLVSPIALNRETMNRAAPFSPLSAVHMEDNGSQKFYFGESWGNGESSFGFLYEYNGTHVRGLRGTDFSTITPPILSRNGKSMWIGGTASSLHAWVNNKPFTSPRSWAATLGSNNKPLTHAPIHSSENNMLFVLTHDGKIFCLDAKTGEKIWSNNDLRVSSSIIRLSGDETILIAIGKDDGILAQLNATTGTKLVELSCNEIRDSKSCTMPVEGDIFVSNSGDEISFANTYGDVYLLHFDQMTDRIIPTRSPSLSPTTHPTMTPTENTNVESTNKPTAIRASLTPTKKPTRQPTNEVTLKSPLSPGVLRNTTRKPSHSQNDDESPAVSPAWTPAFSPADSPFASPAAAIDRPMGKSQTSRPTDPPSLQLITSAPVVESTIDLEVFEVNLATLMDSEDKASPASTSNPPGWVYAIVFVVTMTFIAVLGILIGGNWQRRRYWRCESTTVTKDENLYNQSSISLQSRYID